MRWKAELSICLCVVGMRWLGGIWVVRDSEIYGKGGWERDGGGLGGNGWGIGRGLNWNVR